jgi:hypothetical protein
MAELIGAVIEFMLCSALVLPIAIAIWAVLKSF